MATFFFYFSITQSPDILTAFLQFFNGFLPNRQFSIVGIDFS